MSAFSAEYLGGAMKPLGVVIDDDCIECGDEKY